MKGEWHFLDYPKVDDKTSTSDTVLCKTTDSTLVTCTWDENLHSWFDYYNDPFTKGIACWSYISGVPDTEKPMPK